MPERSEPAGELNTVLARLTEILLEEELKGCNKVEEHEKVSRGVTSFINFLKNGILKTIDWEIFRDQNKEDNEKVNLKLIRELENLEIERNMLLKKLCIFRKREPERISAYIMENYKKVMSEISASEKRNPIHKCGIKAGDGVCVHGYKNGMHISEIREMEEEFQRINLMCDAISEDISEMEKMLPSFIKKIEESIEIIEGEASARTRRNSIRLGEEISAKNVGDLFNEQLNFP